MYGDSNKNKKNRLEDSSWKYHKNKKNLTRKFEDRRQTEFGVFLRQLQTRKKGKKTKKKYHHHHHEINKKKIKQRQISVLES